MSKGANKTRVVVTAVVAAMWLAACGGGGGGGTVAGAPAPAPAPGPGLGGGGAAPAPAPAQALSWSGPVALATDAQGNAVTQDEFHWVTTNADGSVMAAGTIPGPVYLSRDGGASWARAGDLPDASWISVKMSTDASRMVAVGFGGAMYVSSNGGVNWTRADVAFNPNSDIMYESVSISGLGDVIVSAELNGPLRRSIDGGTTFLPVASAGTHSWRAVDMTSTGSVMVAVAQDRAAMISTDGGATFSDLFVSLDGVNAVTDGWYRAKVSEDGNTIVLVGSSEFTAGTGAIYVSKDRGATWTQASNTTGNPGTYTGIGMSANGQLIALTVSDDGGGATPGTVLVSTDGGTSFTTMSTLPGETNWRNIAINAAGTRAVLAAGRFFGATGGLYTSSGDIR